MLNLKPPYRNYFTLGSPLRSLGDNIPPSRYLPRSMTDTKFTDLQLIAPLQLALKESGYEKPTPIQQQAIPIILEGHDLLGIAQTGTG